MEKEKKVTDALSAKYTEFKNVIVDPQTVRMYDAYFSRVIKPPIAVTRAKMEKPIDFGRAKINNAVLMDQLKRSESKDRSLLVSDNFR